MIFHCSAAYGQIAIPPAEWEYKQLFNNPSDEILNYYAKNGWEIDVAIPGDVILKRSRSHPLFGTRTPEMPKPEPPPQSCKLTLAQAPVIRGLRLGMTSDELFAIFPSNEREEFDRAQQLKGAELPPNYRYTNIQLYPSASATKDRFTGISSFTFGLFDRKVVFIGAQYSNTPQFDSQGQLMEIITGQCGLPEFKDWPGHSVYMYPASLACEGFTFQVYGYGESFSIQLTDPSYKKIAEERQKADRAKKREGFKL